MPRSTIYKIVAGHVNVATVDAATAIPAWALVTGQSLLFPWDAPEMTDNSIPRKVKPRFADGSSKPHGGYRWSWTFQWLVVQWDYFRGEFLPVKDMSQDVTTLQYDEEDDPIYIQSKLHYPSLGEGLASIGEEFYRVQLEFTNGKAIT